MRMMQDSGFGIQDSGLGSTEPGIGSWESIIDSVLQFTIRDQVVSRPFSLNPES
jgi:hypothetical protein